MKKKKLLSLPILVLLGIMSIGGIYKNANSNNITDMSYLVLGNLEALAEGDEIKDCPGGSCTFSDNFGNTCSACCPEDKNPDCGTFGCSCR